MCNKIKKVKKSLPQQLYQTERIVQIALRIKGQNYTLIVCPWFALM